jgi:DNA-binding NtrC family response regulator
MLIGDAPTRDPAGTGRAGFAGRERPARLVGTSPAARLLEQLIDRAAAVEATVFITGETGCGKEEVARALHAAGSRRGRPFVAVNCGAMAPTLIEGQLFGHEKGAFTGAFGPSRGVFRAAEGGMVFLDEIGEMPLELQPRLLRALQEREVTPLGSAESHPFDVRLVVATNRDLEAEVAAGRFREDLFYRINTIEIPVPALRDRLEDVPAFVEHFRRLHAAAGSAWRPDAATLGRFLGYHWPGNVRQLAQAVERGIALGHVPPLPGEGRPPEAGDDRGGRAADELPVLDLETLRRMAVRQALARTGGHKGQAAALLGVHINTMTKLVEDAVPEASSRRRVGSRRPAPTPK